MIPCGFVRICRCFIFKCIDFPRFADAPEGGITAWYTMRLTEIGENKENPVFGDLQHAIRDYEERDKSRADVWLRHFANDLVAQS